MIYFIYGDDIEKRRSAHAAVSKLYPLAIRSRINSESMSAVDEGIESQSMFGDTMIYELNGMLEKKETREYLYDRMEMMMNSDNVFLVDDVDILKATATKVSKFATKSYNCQTESAQHEREFMPEALCSAVQNKDRRHAFIELHKLLNTGESGEAISAILWWKVKSMIESLLAGKQYITEFKGKDSSGRATWDKRIINYKLSELEDIGFRLIITPARAHTDSSVDIAIELEKIILSI